MYANTTFPRPLSAAAFYVLLAVARSELHAYRVNDQIWKDSLGSLKIAPGQLYTLINRLHDEGLIDITDERPTNSSGVNRLHYQISEHGRIRLQEELERLDHAVRIGRAAGLMGNSVSADIQRLQLATTAAPTPAAATDTIAELLAELYGPAIARQVEPRLRKLIAAEPIPPRQFEPTQADAMLIAFADHIRSTGEPPLRVFDQFARRHFDGVVSTVHLLPFYPWTSDRGFGVSDFTRVKPEYGDWADIRQLGRHFHLAFDFVLNHVSASHPWFVGFRAGDPRYHNYFISLDPATDTSHVFRPRTTSLLTPFETTTGIKHLWTTFGPDQVDLNYANPDVLLEVVAILLGYIRRGADIIRLDSANYIWKDLSTSCNGLPQTHAVIQLLRATIDQAAPWVCLLTETNVAHHDNLSYLGDGYNEAGLAYNFALPPLTIDALLSENAETISDWAAQLELPSGDATLLNFLATHDGIMVNAARDLIPEPRLEAMFRLTVAREGALSYKFTQAGEVVYEMNTTFYSLLTDPDEPMALSIDRFMCAQSIMLTLAGVPGIYLNSLIGSVNYAEGREQYNRLVNEEKFQADSLERELTTPGSRRQRIFDRYVQLLKIRAAQPAFHPRAPQRILRLHPGVFAVRRTARDHSSSLVALHNVSAKSIDLSLEHSATDLITGQAYGHRIALGPYQTAWLKQDG